MLAIHVYSPYSDSPVYINHLELYKHVILMTLQVETVQDDGSRRIVFPNGTHKVISADGKTVTVHCLHCAIRILATLVLQ